MTLLFEHILSYLYDYQTLLLFNAFAIVLKGYLLVYLYRKRYRTQKTLYLRRMLIIALFCGMVITSAWIMVLCQHLAIIKVPAVLGWSLLRLSWLCYFIYYQAIALFIKHITQKESTFQNRSHLDLIPLSLIFCTYAVYSIIYYQSTQATQCEQYIRLAGELYGIFVLIIPSILYTAQTIKDKAFPRILAVQIQWALLVFIVPLIIIEIVTLFLSHMGLIGTDTYFALSTLSTSLVPIDICLTGRRISRLRFLNLHNKVMSAPRATFATEMKKISSELNTTTSPDELRHIIKSFFDDAFSIPIKKTHFYLHNNKNNLCIKESALNIQLIIKTFFTEEADIAKQIKQREILIMDELMFSNFYKHNPTQKKLIKLLEQINADLLLPIFKQDTVVACIVVDRHARKNKLYSNVESDEMIVFSRCIGNLVNILQNKDLEVVVGTEHIIRQQLHSNQRDLKEELCHKHQENNQYKESLRSFLRTSEQREIGILFYKNRRFSLVNHTAQTLINLDLNKYPGHPLTRSITRIARDAETYNTTQSCIVKTKKDKRLVISAVPSLDKNNVIITAHPPEVSDLVKKQIDVLKEPRNWDYLLYLETTKSGGLINELIPGSSESILNFKIEFLKIALCGRASLITAPLDDVVPLVNILHQISMRETLHVIQLHEPSTSSHTALEIFGANTHTNPKNNEPSLLKKLDKVGTLLIENVQHLTLSTQQKLAEYLLYGYFKPVHSEEKIVSDVRIICSSNQDLKSMMHKGLFDDLLYKMLQDTSVKMPSLTSLDSDEFNELISNIASQSVKKDELELLIGLSKREKNILTNTRPTSLTQLRHNIQTLLMDKSENSPLSYDNYFDEDITDPIIVRATALGKKALLDKELMEALWNKLKNYNQIGHIIGVNRSTVLRRCRVYNIVPKKPLALQKGKKGNKNESH